MPRQWPRKHRATTVAGGDGKADALDADHRRRPHSSLAARTGRMARPAMTGMGLPPGIKHREGPPATPPHATGRKMNTTAATRHAPAARKFQRRLSPRKVTENTAKTDSVITSCITFSCWPVKVP